MKIRTKQATTVLTKQLPEMRWTARTAVKTALQILQRTHPATKHPVHTTENRTNTPTKNNIKQNFRQLFSLLKAEDRLRETAKPVFI